MPNDLFNVKKIYPDAQMGFKFFHYTKGAIKNIMHATDIQETSVPGWFEFMNDAMAELKVVALGSESFASGNTVNHEIAKQQKFLSTINDFKNIEASWYLKFESGTDPWCVCARMGARESYRKPCLAAGYRAYLRPDGAVRLAKDAYFGARTYFPENNWLNVIPALTADQIIGMKFICFNMDDDESVRLEIWLDELNNNNWKEMLSFTDTPGNWGGGGNRCGCVNDKQPIVWGGPTVAFAAEGNSPANTRYAFANATVREINAGGSFAEARAGTTVAIAGGGQALNSIHGQIPGSDSGGGVGDGGGGAGDDHSTGTGGSNVHEPVFTVQPTGSTSTTGLPFPFPPQSGTGGTTSSPIGSPSTGTNATPTAGTNQRPERPLVTLFKDLGLMYNIVLDHSSPCDVGNPFVIDYRQIYQAGGVDTQEIKLYLGTGGFVATGAKAHSSISALVNRIVRKVTVSLRKFGNPTTGNVGCQIRDKNGLTMHTFPTTIDPATIPTGAFGPTYTFTSDANTYPMTTGDMVLIVYNDTAGTTNTNANNCIIMKSTDKDETDGFDTVQVSQYFASLAYIVDQDKDMVGTIFI
jgi:hypothetical protein